MTGATIQSNFDDAELRRGLQGLTAMTEDFRTMLKRVGVGLVETTLRRFETATDPQGNPWASLNPAYAAAKQGAGILRGKAMRGGLMGSMTFQVRDAREVAVGTNKIYGGVHQFGAVIRPVRARSLVFRIGKHVIHTKQVRIPARPYLGFGTADRTATLEAVKFTLAEALRGERAS